LAEGRSHQQHYARSWLVLLGFEAVEKHISPCKMIQGLFLNLWPTAEKELADVTDLKTALSAQGTVHKNK
jgi:hypothetical protein